jgi:anaerobic ribonucleoside-triphosphate reductase
MLEHTRTLQSIYVNIGGDERECEGMMEDNRIHMDEQIYASYGSVEGKVRKVSYANTKHLIKLLTARNMVRGMCVHA